MEGMALLLRTVPANQMHMLMEQKMLQLERQNKGVFCEVGLWDVRGQTMYVEVLCKLHVQIV
jgi:hypothetical protein